MWPILRAPWPLAGGWLSHSFRAQWWRSLARSARPEPRELVERAAEDVEPEAESPDTEPEDQTGDRAPTSGPDPETPDVKESEVEGAVT